MALEQLIEKLTAAIEAHTGVLVTMGGLSTKAQEKDPIETKTNGAAAPNGNGATATQPTPPKRGPGRPPAAPKAPVVEPPSEDEGLGDDDDFGGSGLDEELSVTAEQGRAAVLAYRDKAIKVKGKDEGLSKTRALMKKYVANLDEITADNAAEIKTEFDAAIAKLK